MPFNPQRAPSSADLFLQNPQGLLGQFADPAARSAQQPLTGTVLPPAPRQRASAPGAAPVASGAGGGFGVSEILAGLGNFGQIVIDPQTGGLTVQGGRSGADQQARARREERAEENEFFRRQMQLARLNISQKNLQHKLTRKANTTAAVDRLIERWGQ